MVDYNESQVKRRRITEKDYARAEQYITDELAKRENMKARKSHEKQWKEMDRQIAMEPPTAIKRSGNPDEDWHNAIQLGAIADALEIISADIMRLAFPVDRNWFQPHVELSAEIDPETGEPSIDPFKQRVADGVLRSLMGQQHSDFGFKDRVKAAVKEALSHGGFCAEMRMESLRKIQGGGRVQTLRAPMPFIHSMWNVFPDPSPSIMGTELFYRGRMIIRYYMPRDAFMRNPMFIRKEKVPKQQAKPKDDAVKDVEMVCYYGDLTFDRRDGDMYLPNMKVILANGILVYQKQNELPYSPVIYTGYERDSLLDPYYTSPLIKRAPTNKLATEFMNRFADAAELKADPALFYDAYDTTMVMNGGPKIYPGAKEAVKGGAANVKPLDIGDPSFMFEAYQDLRREINVGTSVDSNRSGVSPGTEQTATEITRNEQQAEVRTVDFLAVMDRQFLKPSLNMQHDYNLRELDNYPFYNNEQNTPDFLRVSRDELPKNVIFNVVGSKEVLGEQQRFNKFVASIQFASSIPQLNQTTDWGEVGKEIWHFSGLKDPERFSISGNNEKRALVQQFQQEIQQYQQQMQELAQENQVSDLEKAKLQSDINELKNEIKLLEEAKQGTTQLVSAQRRLDDTRHQIELLLQRLSLERSQAPDNGNTSS